MATPLEVSDELVGRFKAAISKHFDGDRGEKFLKASKVITLANTEKEHYSAVYRNSLGGLDKDLNAYFDAEINNYYTLFECTCALYGDRKYLGKRLFNNTKPGDYDDFYTFQSRLEVRTRRNNLGAGIVQVVTNHRLYGKEVVPHVPEFEDYNNNKPYRFVVALYSANRPEWVITDLACQAYNMVNTALYDTMGPESSVYILETTRSPVVVASQNKIMLLLMMKKEHPKLLSSLLVVISLDRLDIQEDYALFCMAADLDINLYDLAQVELLGRNFPVPLSPVTKDDVYTISFTSGTTGLPKGVVVSQKMLIASIRFSLTMTHSPFSLNPFNGEVRYLCFLPLTHIFERQIFIFVSSTGRAVGFPLTDVPVNTLIQDLKSLKPHMLVAVPRLYTKFEALLKEAIDKLPLVVQTVVNKGIQKRAELQALADVPANTDFYLFDKLFTNKFRAALGFDCMDVLLCGSAPISVETIKFLKAALNIGFGQGWGMTETFAGVTSGFFWENDPSSVGHVGVSVDFRLRDVPEMNYFHNDGSGEPKGEILVRGPQVFKYYYKRPDETKKAFDEDGFFHTGDIGKIDKYGRVHIVDRVKNFFKLAQGEYISPERIENTYLSNCPLLTQAFVYGNSYKSYLVAILGFEPAMLKLYLHKHAKELPKDMRHHIDTIIRENHGADINETALFNYINENSQLRKFLVQKLNIMVNVSKKPGDKNILQGFEKFHNFYADIMPLKLEEDVITPTFKLKRVKATKRFKSQLDALYEEGSLVKNGNI